MSSLKRFQDFLSASPVRFAVILMAAAVALLFAAHAHAAFPVYSIGQGGTATGTQVTNGVNYSDGTKITSGTGLTFTGSKLGVATTSPYGTLSISGQAGTNALVISTSSNTVTAFRVSANGNLHLSNGAGIDIGTGTTPPANGLVLGTPLGISSGSTASSSAITNGVCYYNGSSIECDGMFTFNAGALAIGNAGSASAITVSGSSGQPTLSVNGFTSGSASMQTNSSSQRNLSLRNSGSGGLYVRIGLLGDGENRLSINATSTPAAILSLAGSLNGTAPLMLVSSSSPAGTTTVIMVDSFGNLASYTRIGILDPNSGNTPLNFAATTEALYVGGVKNALPNGLTGAISTTSLLAVFHNHNSSNGQGAAIGFDSTSATTQSTAAMTGVIGAYRTGTNGQGGLFFGYQPSTTGAGPLVGAVLDNNGNLGVGTTSPPSMLTVQGYVQPVSTATTTACSTVTEGAQFYNLSNHHQWLCMGAEPWTLLK